MTPARRRPRDLSARSLRRAAAAGSAAVVLASLVACVPGESAGPERGTQSAAPEVIGDVPAELESYYMQEVVWDSCEDSYLCASIEVPLDYSNPGDNSIELEVILSEAGGTAEGTILVNPGGPGGSGYDTVLESLEGVTTSRLRDDFNILGFDPRGVGRSTPVDCLTDEELDASRNETFDPSTDAGFEEARANAADYAAQCAEESGDLLGFVDTASAARDMDILRAVAGDSKLNYLGFSYGTFLGATYAELFPKTVGRMVLDGGIDPSASNEEITLGQARAFEKAIRAYVEDCLTSSNCPLSGTVDDAVETIRDLIASVEVSPMTAADGRTVTASTFVSGFILPLYNDANWPALTQALSSALRGDPTTILMLADLGAEREEDGSYASNSFEVFSAVNCLDYPMETDRTQMDLDAAELEAASPTLGRFLAYGGLTCEAWPHEPTGEPHRIAAEGAAPILVLGTTGDPATPYEWSQALAGQLDSAVLVTWEAEGHTAYGRGNQCIADAVDDYFIDGTVPQDGLVCS
ncbi:alpha/beta hydrolase [Arthrobacter caoxuetaonis]|uniref:alpha/beta hydrolase n=1 Tax=Arthrobacter caoxuetaonis TaxID=2886935 RepID=UPI001D14F64F|nr:alpha/beta hydrolase [Arthrobacter caoxuetaonis]MCC3283137.1 alpha/beta hydrolase [Arthrobacter caoxuetaonis]